MSYRAQDMPELRASMVDWNQQHGPTYFTSCITAGAQRVYTPTLRAQTAGSWFAETEAARLAQSELFWVSGEMTELCVSAARSMPDWSLSPEDLPTPYGLIYFEGLSDLREFPTTAIAWGRCPAEAADFLLKGPGIWLSCYVSKEWIAAKEELNTASLRMPLPPLLYDGESLAAYGTREDGDVSYTTTDGEDLVSLDDNALINRASSLVVLKTAWLLMQQELAEVTPVEPDRATRKRLKRMGKPDPTRTRIIRLRRQSSSASTSSEDREYHHRWIVRGHWRQHWFPKRQVHRPVWIAPHVKGPEGAPLIGGEKVYALKR